MSDKKCKSDKKKELDSDNSKEKKFKCKKCDATSNKEKKLCKPVKNSPS